MLRRLIPVFIILCISFSLVSCDVSKKIKDNQKDIAALKEESRFLKESVGNYERMVKKLRKDVDYLSSQVRALKKKRR